MANLTQPSEVLMSERAARVGYAALGELEKALDLISGGSAMNPEKLDTLANVAHAASQFLISDDKSGDGPEFE